MNFKKDLLEFSSKVKTIKDSIKNEQGTCLSLILPMLQLLGYNTSDPHEVIPEYSLSFGAKKDARADYAIVINGETAILIEAKWCGMAIDKHASQLFQYYAATPARFGILTNGIDYYFYTDTDRLNVMDKEPYFKCNLLDLTDEAICEIKKFKKELFNSSNIFASAESIKYIDKLKSVFNSAIVAPTDDFVKFFITDIYTKAKTQAALDRFRPLVKKAVDSCIDDIVKGKLSKALEPDSPHPYIISNNPKIVTTEEELQGYSLVRNILKGIVPAEDIVYKDCMRYIAVLYQCKTTQWICRLELMDNRKTLILPAVDRTEERHLINSVVDIVNYKDKLIESLKRYL